MTARAAVRSEKHALLPHHQALIEASAISPEVAAARGYRSVTTRAELRGLGFSEKQCRTPALLIPVWGVTGEIDTYQARPDEARVNRNGKAAKYETPAGSRMVLDVPPLVREKLRDPGIPLFITEGARKADAAVTADLCCIALLGVWNFRGTNEHGGKTALADWEQIARNGREVYICFDSDVMLKAAVHEAMARLKAFLERAGARVHLIYLPSGAGGEKIGLDDYLADGHTVADLLAHASDMLREGQQEEGDGAAAGPYRETETGLVWMKATRDGEAPVPLTNFTARITGQVVRDDGSGETQRLFEVVASLSGREFRFPLAGGAFAAMNWPLEHMGASAIVHPGFGLSQHARAAIQMFSNGTQERRVFTHTGWREVRGAHVYLHGGGAVGAEGTVRDVCVELPDSLGPFVLTTVPEGDRLREAVRASLRVLEVAPDAVTVPVLCAVYRAPLGAADCALHIVGPTGEGKTELAALGQQHFGAGFAARNLPGSWGSTGNANEGLAFLAKDALLVIDDFAPGGTATDIARTHREGDRVLRAQGNRSGRLRMRADGTLRPPKRPRGLILSTGEEVPRGESLHGRLLVLDLPKGGMDWGRLTECQEAGSEGLLAEAMAAYVCWLAARYGEVGPGGGLQREVRQLRQTAAANAAHRRTPEVVANLAVGLRYFLTFAQVAGVLNDDESEALWRRGWRALRQAAVAHSARQSATNPADAFARLLGGAIASGSAHLAAAGGGEPDAPQSWGWRHEQGAWRPLGRLVGWVQGEDVYLEPDSAYAAANALAQATGEALAVSPRTLWKRLHDRELLLSMDAERETLKVRRTLAGARRHVLHLSSSALLSGMEPDQPDHEAPGRSGEVPEGPSTQLPGRVQSSGDTKPDRDSAQGDAAAQTESGQAQGEAPLVGLVGSSATGRGSKETGNGSGGSPDTAGPPYEPCHACQATRYWRPVNGGHWRCGVCYPPPFADMVAEWADAGASGVDAAVAVANTTGGAR